MSAWKTFVRAGLVRWLKVPTEPQAPVGSPGSVRTFRASVQYFRLKQLGWFAKQLALLGFAIAFAVGLHEAWSHGQIHLPSGRSLRDPTLRWVEGGLVTLHLLPLLVELLSMPFTYALAWLDYDQRWYITTDRSLRIREGLWRVREVTLTFANIQQMTIRQGPVQRFLGIADLVVTTAGGGGGATAEPGQNAKEPVHTGVLRGVSNAEEIRDWILAKSRELKDSGLGDPDDAMPGVLDETGRRDSRQSGLEVLEAARMLKAESAALRATLMDPSSPGTGTSGRMPGRTWEKM